MISHKPMHEECQRTHYKHACIILVASSYIIRHGDRTPLFYSASGLLVDSFENEAFKIILKKGEIPIIHHLGSPRPGRLPLELSVAKTRLGAGMRSVCPEYVF